MNTKFLKYAAGRAASKAINKLKEVILNSRKFNVCTNNLNDSRTTVIHQSNINERATIQYVNSNAPTPFRKEMIGDFDIGTLHIVSKQNIRLIGNLATPVDESGLIPIYAIVSQNYRAPVNHIDWKVSFIYKQPTKSSTVQLERAVTLVNAWSKSYFHWFVENLPRLAYIKEMINQDVAVVIDSQPTAWQLRSLELLGIKSEKIINAGEQFEVQELIIPPHVRVIPTGYRFSVLSTSLLEFMRKRIFESLSINEATQSKKRNIYISRKLAVGRKISNEDELSNALNKLEFETYYLEKLSFDEQVKLFSTAGTIVAPHGAGLTNILWSSKAKVIELYSDDAWNGSFLTLANALQHEYYLFKGTSTKTLISKRADIIVNIPEFMQFMRENDLA